MFGAGRDYEAGTGTSTSTSTGTNTDTDTGADTDTDRLHQQGIPEMAAPGSTTADGMYQIKYPV